MPLGEGDYADDATTYHAFLYETVWDGPLRFQPEEVASGEWMTLEALAAMIDDPAVAVMPDTATLLGPWLARPAGRPGRARAGLGQRDHDRRGAVARPATAASRGGAAPARRDPAAARMLAPRLGLAVPVPVVLEAEPLLVRHPLVPGDPCEPAALTAADGDGGRALPAGPPRHRRWSEVADTGVPDAAATRAELLEGLAGMRERVLPAAAAGPARGRCGRCSTPSATPSPVCLVHADLGPEHLLVADGRVSGVIDWSDARAGDPALDLAWTLNGTPAAFADALVAAYSPTTEQVARGRLWHRLGPWWEAPCRRGLPGGRVRRRRA